jgi:opacity protein-like surface antigen
MKKSLLAISLISSFAFAEFETKALVGASSANLDGENFTQYNVGYTANTRLENQVILGFGNTLSYGSSDKLDVYTLDLDLKAGYEIYKDLTAFAIGTGAVQSADNDSAWGYGYGAALEYKLTSNVSLEGSYKTLTMQDGVDYDYDTTNFGVKFNY